MPQLIAMIIIVVGAMIYMFQTFGGTGDKIEGIAQKASVITEINNVKNAVKLAARAQQLSTKDSTTDGKTTTTASNMKALAELNYFAEQMNDQIKNNNVTTAKVGEPYDPNNAYHAISFGGTNEKVGGMYIALVAPKQGSVTTNDGGTTTTTSTGNRIPGIFVDFNFIDSSLADSAGFLESQIANDLKDIAYIDRYATKPEAGTGNRYDAAKDSSSIAGRTPNDAIGGTESDGKFIIYFKDFGANEVVIDEN